MPTILKNPNFRFFLQLILLHLGFRFFFGIYNADIMENWNLDSIPVFGSLLYWSMSNDSIAIASLNLPFFLLLSLPTPLQTKRRFAGSVLFTAISFNTFALALSLFDTFYFRFHLQRADADLLHVLFNPFNRGSLRAFAYAAAALVTVYSLFHLLMRPYKKNPDGLPKPTDFRKAVIILSVPLALIVAFQKKQFHPNYALTEVNYRQLPLVQNSLHCLVYSLFRNDEFQAIRNVANNIPSQVNTVEIRKKNILVSPATRNLVLFIMESVPYDFFDTSNPHHVALPFLDSIRERSEQFNKAYSFSYNSNKGITALLAGLPTATDIPLYHSRFTLIPHTGIGFALKQKGYHSSFVIGDDYDDFGFAKCCNWLGIDRYLCRKDIPVHHALPRHPLGLHDEAVLPFLLQELDKSPAPFLAVHYNISTHYPYDLPAAFVVPPGMRTSPKPRQAMFYYDRCLGDFFNEAKNKSWFNNTVFVFCADHWSQPNDLHDPIDPEKSFRIPLFIYDPQNPVKKIHSSPVSQLDILNTLLAYAAYSDSLTSYGVNLMETPDDPERVVFSKLNNAIYQAINRQYVLGYNVYEGKPAYAYDLVNDPSRKHDLLLASDTRKLDPLVTQLQAFLKTLSLHYLEKNSRN